MSNYILTVEEASKLDVDCPPSVGSYRCNKCKHKLERFTNRRMIDYKFCPYCGKSLYKDSEDDIKPVASSSISEIKCPIDLNKFALGVPFENTFSGEECKKAKFYGDCFHCWSSSIAKRDKQIVEQYKENKQYPFIGLPNIECDNNGNYIHIKENKQ